MNIVLASASVQVSTNIFLSSLEIGCNKDSTVKVWNVQPSRAMVVILKNAVSGARRRSEGTWESNPIKSFLPAVQIYLSKSCVCLWILGWRRLYIFFYPEIMRHSRKKRGFGEIATTISIYLSIYFFGCVCVYCSSLILQYLVFISKCNARLKP